MAMLDKFGVSTPFDTDHTFVTSPLFSPTVLAIIRLLLAFYTLFTAVFILVWEFVKQDINTYFSYFSHLSLIGLCAYFFASAVQTLVYSRGSRKGYPLQRWPKILQILHVLLHSSAITFPILVTIIYWALLADSSVFRSRFTAWSSISVHILNTVFALTEIFSTHARPSPWLHLPVLVLILCGYLGVAYISHATQNFYTYSFLDPRKQGGKLAAYIIGIAIAQVIVFTAVRFCVIFREWAFSSYVRHLAPPAAEKLDEWEEMERPGTPRAI